MCQLIDWMNPIPGKWTRLYAGLFPRPLLAILGERWCPMSRRFCETWEQTIAARFLRGNKVTRLSRIPVKGRLSQYPVLPVRTHFAVKSANEALFPK